MSEISTNKRIAKNTIMLYIRMGLSTIIGLYTSRVVLSTLGVEDYGIYSVVGGVVAMFGFLNASMSGATSRFITFELGRGDKERLQQTFSSSLMIHIGIALLIFVLGETVGLWFLYHKLVIPAAQFNAALWVYQLSILSTMVSITQVPYNACIISHEKMDVYAYVELLNVMLKLLIVYLLVILPGNKLIIYGGLVFGVSLLIAMTYRIYCIRHFTESKFKWSYNKEILKPMLSFSSWDLYGNMCVTAKHQGIVFLINIFFGVALNAAAGLANTVSGVVTGFTYNLITAFRPQITKQYAVGDIQKMQLLLTNAIKYAMLLVACFVVPLLFELNYVMKLWLTIVPDYAVLFCRLLLISSFFGTINSVLCIAIHATGNIKRISIYTGTIFLFHLPFIYLLYHVGADVSTAYGISILFIIAILACNLNILKLQIKTLQIQVLLITFIKVLSFVLIAVIPLILVYNLMKASFMRLCCITILYWSVLGCLSFIFLLDLSIKNKILDRIVSYCKN